jgi:hypothetical protein
MAEINITRQIQGVFSITLRNSDAGDEIVYHIGDHASGPHKTDALKAALEGKCFIFQRRIREGLFSYIAVKASEKHSKRMRGVTI